MDLLLVNGRILTMSAANPVVEALAIARGRVAAVGSAAALRSAAPPGARVVDLAGRTVTPGFNDSHMHVLPYGMDLAQADLSPRAGVRDIAGLVDALRRWAAAHPAADWVRGSRYDQNVFPGAAHPTRADLDAAFAERPVWVSQTSKHAGACNSAALRLAGVDQNTPDPDGGAIVRDEAGEPTGVMLESAMGLVTRWLPKPGRAAMVEAIRRACEALLRVGVTSASDLNTGWFHMATEIEAYRQAVDQRAALRITLCPHAVDFGEPQDVPSREAFAADCGLDRPPSAEPGQGGVRLGPAKLFSDGALTVRTAALREPYVDGAGDGMLLHPVDELRSYVRSAHAAGWQVATHAIGDRAIAEVLDAYAMACGEDAGVERRHRVEHAMLLTPDLRQRLVRQRVVPTMQPEFVARLGDAYVMGLGEERAATLNPVASLLRAGVGVPFGSDCPIVPGAPLDGVRAAIARTTASGRVLGPTERIGAADALRNYTWWSAYSTFDEAETGSLERGKRADLVVLSADPAADGPDPVEVVATVVAGRFVSGTELA
ncbi:MAG: amidohydrolase [Chthonomonadales bacterium]|nr:amidohydrolase [Chthonomonadales bacterium]